MAQRTLSDGLPRAQKKPQVLYLDVMEVVNTDGDLDDSRPAMKWFRKTSDRDHPRQHSAPRPNTIWWKLVRLVDGVQVAVPAAHKRLQSARHGRLRSGDGSR